VTYRPNSTKSAALVAAFVHFAIANSASAQAAIRFDLPAEPLEDALRAVAKKTDINILIDRKLVGHLRAPALHGELSIDQALGTLLQGTNLHYEFVNESTVVLTPEPKASSSGQGGAYSPASSLSYGATDPTTALEEIIVTARRRAEDLQEVPISITALSANTLRANDVQDPYSLQYLTPSLSISNSSGDRYTPSFTIRAQGPSPGSSPGVVVYLDEVPLVGFAGATVGAPGYFFDLENIQVLKGPQGTLFGRNTDGGAVLVQSALPQNDFGGNAQVTLGNYGDREFEGALNVPIVDHMLLARLAVSYQDRDGFTQQQGEPGRALDGIDSRAVRFTLRFMPNDSIRNDAIYRYNHFSSNGTSLILSAVDPARAAAGGFPGLGALFAQQQALGVRRELHNDLLEGTRRDYWSAEDILRLDFGPNVDLRNIVSYSVIKFRSGFDWDSTDLPLFQFNQGTPSLNSARQFTEEAQLQGKALRGNLTWNVGAFYLNNPATGVSSTTIFGAQDRLFSGFENHSKAIYTQESYDLSSLTEGLRVTGGYRYTWDYSAAFLTAYDGNFQCPTGPIVTCQAGGSATFRAPTWNADLDYDLVRGTMLYVAVKKGYRAGGFNANSAGAVVIPFRPEYLTDHEIGLKSEWDIAGVKARTNFDYYFDKYDAIQTGFGGLYNGIPLVGTINAANARIQGTEFDGSIFPTTNWQVGATFSYINFAVTQYLPGAQISALTQAHPYPKWKYSLNSQYKFPMGKLGDLSVGANWSWQGTEYLGGYSDPYGKIPPYGVLNVNTSWDNIDGRPLEASFFMTNALNRTYVTGEQDLYGFTGTSALIYNAPRMYGIRLNYKFAGAR